MPRDEENRALAEWLGWQYRPAFNSEGAFSTKDSYWHHPDCADSSGHKDCGASDLDFSTSAEMCRALMEKAPEPDLWLESAAGKLPKIWGYTPDLNSPDDSYAEGPTPLAAVVAGTLLLIEKEKP